MSNTTKNSKLPYNYKWFNGMIMTEAETNEYNRITDEISQTYYATSRIALENHRHRFVNQCIAVHAAAIRDEFK